MMQFLIAAAIGFMFAVRWRSLIWPVGAALAAAITLAACLVYAGAVLPALAVTVLGYNAGLLAAVLLFHTGWSVRIVPALATIRSLSSKI